jgi:hypothetical protein
MIAESATDHLDAAEAQGQFLLEELGRANGRLDHMSFHEWSVAVDALRERVFEAAELVKSLDAGGKRRLAGKVAKIASIVAHVQAKKKSAPGTLSVEIEALEGNMTTLKENLKH